MPLPESVDSGPPVTGDVVVVSVTPREVLVAGGAGVTVGSPDTGSDGPPVERSLAAELIASVSDAPACPFPDPQLAAANPTVAVAQARATQSTCTGRTIAAVTLGRVCVSHVAQIA